MRILIAESEGYSREALDVYRSLGEIVLADADRESLKALLPEADVLVVRLRHVIDADMLSHPRKLKVVVSPTTGLNHLDVELLRESGVAVLSLKGESDFLRDVTATAELAWSLLLNLFRPVCAAREHVLAGHWNRDAFKGRELKGKVLGIVGYGRLGRMMALYGGAFRMRVLATDPCVNVTKEDVSLVSLDDLLRQSDVVSLHVPLNEETSGFFDARCFEAMKPGACFINTSRGELVDERALHAALQSGHIAGAALDVLCGETSRQSDWLTSKPLLSYARSHDNLIIVPHIGGATSDSMAATEIFMAVKLQHFLTEQQHSDL
jgi:Phosphoglycerate dehydrogenase and related dehydrogenases